MTTIGNRYLAGNFGPVQEELTAFDLPVTGRIPDQLDGRYLRNGPNPVTPVDPRLHHWFVGTGMVHGVRLRGGRAEWYRNRYVLGDEAAQVLGRPPLEGPRDALFGGASPNTNVIGVPGVNGGAGTTLAIVEAGGYPVELNDELESVRYHDLDGTWAGTLSAHPKVDPVTGELFVAGYSPMFGNEISYQVLGPDLRVRHSIRIDVGAPIMLHDIAITETRAVIFDLPVTLSAEAMTEGYPLPYRWDPNHPPRVGVLPRYGTADQVAWCEVSPCYVYHPMNAFDLPDGRLVVDVSRHPKMFATDLNGPWEGPPVIERWTLDPAAGKVHTERLDDSSQEFPRIDERLVGRPYRYGWSASFGTVGPEHRGLTKWDLHAGTSERHDFGPGRSSGEGVFVPRAPDAAEDDGWVMSLVHDRAEDRSALVILDARAFSGEPVAVVHLPARVPYGFHGNWVPSALG